MEEAPETGLLLYPELIFMLLRWLYYVIFSL